MAAQRRPSQAVHSVTRSLLSLPESGWTFLPAPTRWAGNHLEQSPTRAALSPAQQQPPASVLAAGPVVLCVSPDCGKLLRLEFGKLLRETRRLLSTRG
eukprot:3638661-Rhodomonas_salina.1